MNIECELNWYVLSFVILVGIVYDLISKFVIFVYKKFWFFLSLKTDPFWDLFSPLGTVFHKMSIDFLRIESQPSVGPLENQSYVCPSIVSLGNTIYENLFFLWLYQKNFICIQLIESFILSQVRRSWVSVTSNICLRKHILDEIDYCI